MFSSNCEFTAREFSNFGAFFCRHVFSMRYSSESLEIILVISGNGLLFKDMKISLGLLITAWKMYAVFRENRYLEVSTTANNLIRVSAVEPKQILVLSNPLN